MAESAIRRLEDQLCCLVCLERYTDPKLLQCLHAYCHQCLDKLVVRDGQGEQVLTCPECRQVTPVPDSGVSGLQSAFHISRLHETLEELKQLSAHRTKEVSAPVSLETITQVNSCKEHSGKEVELYCETCEELICVKCALKGGKHHSHDYEEINTAFDKFKKEIATSLSPIQDQRIIVDEALKQLDKHCGEISDQQATIEADVHRAFNNLSQILEARKTELISQLHLITQRKLKKLAVQKDQLETTLAKLNSCLFFVKEIRSPEELLSMKHAVHKQVKTLTATFSKNIMRPVADADVVFSFPDDTVTACRNYGQMFVPSSPYPSNCRVTGKGVESAVLKVSETSICTLQAFDSQGQPCEEPIGSSEIELVSEMLGIKTQGTLERKAGNEYEISYMPTVKGKHQLHIKVEGGHVKGSPFSMTAKSPVKELGTPIQTLSNLKTPESVAINQRGEVIVTEWSAHRLSVFSPIGVKLKTFGTRGTNVGEFMYPCGVTTDSNGKIFVADSDNNRIQIFTQDGQFVTAVGTLGAGPLQFSRPIGITFSTANKKLYVADVHNSRIQVLNSDLSFSASFGRRGTGEGQFDLPCGVACDSTGNVYVADRKSRYIQVFTAEGKFLRKFGCDVELSPTGVAVDSENFVYVSDHLNSSVYIFASTGAFVKSFGSGGGSRLLNLPSGLTVDPSGILYVCDLNNHRVQLF